MVVVIAFQLAELAIDYFNIFFSFTTTTDF